MRVHAHSRWWDLRTARRDTARAQVTDSIGNRLHAKNNVGDDGNFVFTAPDFADFDVCFSNVLKPGAAPAPARWRSLRRVRTRSPL